MQKIVMPALATLLLATSTLSAQDVVRLGTEGQYPPYNYLDDNGEIAGFERDFGDEICKRAALNCEWVINDWDSIIPNLIAGNYDVIIAGMNITDERDEVIDFSDPYTRPDPSAYAVTDTDIELESSVIAAQAATIQAAYVPVLGAELVEFATPEETVAAVKNGEADAVIADRAYLVPLVEADPELELLERTEYLGGGLGLGMRESDGELREKLNAAIQSMKDDGSLNAMIAKWLPDSEPF